MFDGFVHMSQCPYRPEKGGSCLIEVPATELNFARALLTAEPFLSLCSLFLYLPTIEKTQYLWRTHFELTIDSFLSCATTYSLKAD